MSVLREKKRKGSVKLLVCSVFLLTKEEVLVRYSDATSRRHPVLAQTRGIVKSGNIINISEAVTRCSR